MNLSVRAGDTSPRSRWRRRRRGGKGATWGYFSKGRHLVTLLQSFYSFATFQFWSLRAAEDGKSGRQRCLSKFNFFSLLSLSILSTWAPGLQPVFILFDIPRAPISREPWPGSSLQRRKKASQQHPSGWLVVAPLGGLGASWLSWSKRVDKGGNTFFLM